MTNDFLDNGLNVGLDDGLNAFITQHLPSINAAGVKVESQNDEQLILSTPLSLNHNDRGNAFGGSIFNIALMACWGALYIECRKHIENPNIVTRDGQIRYRQPCVEETIRATCRKPEARQWDGFFAHYEKTGKTSLSLTSKIMNGDEIAAYFEGVFVLLND